jgi:hypothetical protein
MPFRAALRDISWYASIPTSSNPLCLYLCRWWVAELMVSATIQCLVEPTIPWSNPLSEFTVFGTITFAAGIATRSVLVVYHRLKSDLEPHLV